jgi:hypothetical protein
MRLSRSERSRGCGSLFPGKLKAAIRSFVGFGLSCIAKYCLENSVSSSDVRSYSVYQILLGEQRFESRHMLCLSRACLWSPAHSCPVLIV